MNPPKHILHLISNLDGYALTRQMELLVEHQLRLGMRPQVLALRADRSLVRRLAQRGVSVRTLARRWVRDPFVAARLVAELRRRELDLLHFWGLSAVNYVHAIKRLVPRTPQIASLLDEDLPIGVAKPPTVNKTREEFLAEQSLPSDAKLIAVAGPLVRSQQIDEAIWHYELVRTLHENARLLIFGDGVDRHRLERFTRLTSEPAAVRFLGYRHDFRELLTHTDVFWHTARAEDAIPQTVLEVMAAGLPVIANETNNCLRIIESGANGYLAADNGRAIFARHTCKLLVDAEHANAIGTEASKIAEQYSVEAMQAEYSRRYENADSPSSSFSLQGTRKMD